MSQLGTDIPGASTRSERYITDGLFEHEQDTGLTMGAYDCTKAVVKGEAAAAGAKRLSWVKSTASSSGHIPQPACSH